MFIISHLVCVILLKQSVLRHSPLSDCAFCNYFCPFWWEHFYSFERVFHGASFFKIFFFLLYNIVFVLPYINMNPPRVYMCSPSWTPFSPPSPYHPSGSSQCTIPKHPVSCIEPGLAIHFNKVHLVNLYSWRGYYLIWRFQLQRINPYTFNMMRTWKGEIKNIGWDFGEGNGTPL